MSQNIGPSRLLPADLLRLGVAGLRARPMRVLLSTAGIAIGIAAMLAVVGISSSSHAELDRTLDRLGTNLLTVTPGQTLMGQPAPLPAESTAMVGRIRPVLTVSATGLLRAAVYRTDHVPIGQTGSIAVMAAQQSLLETAGASLSQGKWFNPATAGYPAVILGSTSAHRLGLSGVGMRVWLGGKWFGVAGILNPVPLAPELDTAALVGWKSAIDHLGFDSRPTTIYLRSSENRVDDVRAVLAATANPQAPNEVRVSRPSDALVVRLATARTLNAQLLGLGTIALLIGGIGVANTMIISVLERRSEIGLRRSLGATKGHVRSQFLAESLLLSVVGGAAGTVLGIVATGIYAGLQRWPTVVPIWASAGAVVATATIGVVAGIYPAVRASRMAPAEAVSLP